MPYLVKGKLSSIPHFQRVSLTLEGLKLAPVWPPPSLGVQTNELLWLHNGLGLPQTLQDARSLPIGESRGAVAPLGIAQRKRTF